MKKFKIYTIIGNRPQFIKIDKDLPNQYLIHTGQHYDYEMSQIFFKELKLPKPYVNLNLKFDEAGKMYDKLVKLFKTDNPSLVLVYGDTISTLMGAMAAIFCKIPVAHVEAGCRSFDLNMPEEISRVLVDKISSIKFTTSRECQKNLYDERILTKKDLYLQGDPLFDAMNEFLPVRRTKDYQKYILVTIHRDFNTDDLSRLNKIINGVIISGIDKKIYLPAHPRLLKVLKNNNFNLEKIKIIKPVGYKKMLELESNAWKIITDSGGVQREAYWMRIPCIVLRDSTEWTYTVNDGWAVLAGADTIKIKDAILNFNPGLKTRQSEIPVFGVNKKIRQKLSQFV